ncbi:unnamed protein product [Ostreobium quekettii]|uniref:protein-serine/threonine phosphatase n=1 Tax=Ostreobium quekettii TaxID=121088 RepID=A0A8S1JCL1_9CHLO|nr:unnamed protein product [Ostreobium quekettii]|eukprot:evm.model.scf_3486.1 EVM.evm.TU.scf_3486.1   scf_3486:3994-7153(-)
MADAARAMLMMLVATSGERCVAAEGGQDEGEDRGVSDTAADVGLSEDLWPTRPPGSDADDGVEFPTRGGCIVGGREIPFKRSGGLSREIMAGGGCGWLAAAPAMGSMSSQGWRPAMEDAGTVIEGLLEAPLLFRRGDRVVPPGVEGNLPSLWDDAASSPRSPLNGLPSESIESWQESLDGDADCASDDPRRVDARFHFAGVYDGHGGQAVSRQVAGNLHLHFRRAFDRALDASTPAVKAVDAVPVAQGSRFRWVAPVGACNADHPGLGLADVAGAAKLAFRLMDGQLMDEGVAESMGTTAVVSLVSESHVVVANCGDSRAVLSRGGSAYRLTRDHKPTLEDEQERILGCGGKLMNYNGLRVMGLLAMSRALGDHGLRDAGVVAEPEVTILGREREDEFLVLASDGLWDALTDQEACDLAGRCFQRAQEQEASPEVAVRVAARVLMRAALDRGSKDNITVTIVDLHGTGKQKT